MTISADHENICQPVPGHPEVAANKLAQIWNILNLNCAKSLGSARTLAREWFKQNAKYLT